MSFRVITPSVVPASQDCRASTLLLRHSICTMPTYIVERTQLLILPEDDNEGETGKVVSTIVAWFLKSRRMSDKQPGLVDRS